MNVKPWVQTTLYRDPVTGEVREAGDSGVLDRLVALERENARLRERLERIAGMRLNFLAQEIAREALEGTDG